MDLLQLEHFLAVVEEGTFTRAAERVCRTQPAIARVFTARGDHVTELLGPAASEQELERLATAGALRSFRFFHLATHGQADHRRAEGHG